MEWVEAAKSWGIDPKAELYKLPAMKVGVYAEKDAQLTLELFERLTSKIDSFFLFLKYSQLKAFNV